MAAHETQLPFAADRWRVVAYVRTLQLSQNVPEDQAAGRRHGRHLTKTGAAVPAAGGGH